MAETDLRELDLLLEQLCDGLLDEDHDAASRLVALLDMNETCRRRYVNMLELHATLWTIGGCGDIPELTDSVTQMVSGEEIAVQESGETLSLPSSGHRAPRMPATWHTPLTYLSSGWPVAYLIATVIFGIGALIGAFTYVSQPGDVAQELSMVTKERLAQHAQKIFVGQITGVFDCKWADSTKPSNSGQLAIGEKISISSGLLEITYDAGAKVILQGPVKFEVDSTAGGLLSLGKLTARVEKKAAGGGRLSKKSHSQPLVPNPSFVVRTPTAIVTDLGTEFGVEVDKQGNTTSHVFRGSIQLQSHSDGREPSEEVKVLHENESARVERSGDDGGLYNAIRRITAQPESFIRAMPRPSAQPKVLAEDNAARYHYGWRSDLHSGLGWKDCWQFVAGASDSHSIAASSIATDGKSFASLARSGAPTEEIRDFAFGDLPVGAVFMIDYQNGPLGDSVSAGFGLHNTRGEPRFQLFLFGGRATYRIWNSACQEQDTGIPYTDKGLHVELTRTGPDTYSLKVVRLESDTTYTLDGSFVNTPSGKEIVRFRHWNMTNDRSYCDYLNRIRVVVPPHGDDKNRR